jgi:spore protease
LSERIHPELIIAVDALAARKVSRINSTIQLSDTGVAPGGGVGNNRKRLDEEGLGVPVIAIGVPTVVDAATLANDTLDKMLSAMLETADKNNSFYNMLRDMEDEDKYELINELLTPYEENMFVTPKEVDEVVDCLVNIIANGINIALHPGIDGGDINRFK